MNEDRYSAIRHLEPPRSVRVDPRRMWVLPVRTPERVMPVTLGEKAFALDLHLGEEWIPGRAYRWARFNIGTAPVWFCEIEVQLMTKNGVSGVALRQWVPWDAVQPE
ncbi:hypothetical protein IU459_32645 [Nocardia amamiensis]|uniref:Uncharacterized protein n=1 Tax=Nocardia amamiensis TaxID=404578 RepID=A0ABS0D085_9NOCA|nr:hypothetical protein [Nocardia amamiensis]MBF6302254.1 hypothetical protein [Nocardia amamiensis]